MDVGLCLLALPVALPALIIVSILIRLDSPGPVLFFQDRVGRGGRRFRMYKLRSMHQNADHSAESDLMRAFVKSQRHESTGAEADYKPFGQSQLTRTGRFLRRFSIDELPQLINVLKGDMSLVGPRPNLPLEVEAYLPWHRRRLAALPGITGLAQVRGRSTIPFDRIVEYDMEYIESWTPLLDLKILLWTVPCVVSGRGAR